MRAPLTSKQKKIYDFITTYIVSHKKAPYIREIQETCQINSYKSVIDKLLSMEKKGYIKRRLNKHRSIKLINSALPDKSRLNSTEKREVNSVIAEQGQVQTKDKGLVQEKKMEVQI